MLTNNPPVYRRVFKQPKKPAAPVPLVLEAASYDSNLQLILLTFDRPVNTAAAVTTQFTVNDPVTHNLSYVANGPIVAYGVNGVQIHLMAMVPASGSQVTLNIGVLNGIVAADNGAPLPGVSNLVLPYT